MLVRVKKGRDTEGGGWRDQASWGERKRAHSQRERERERAKRRLESEKEERQE